MHITQLVQAQTIMFYDARVTEILWVIIEAISKISVYMLRTLISEFPTRPEIDQVPRYQEIVWINRIAHCNNVGLFN